jgi:ornithine cyclodeaminase/alanine dehydrogenase-like protein (mu-crystallin family)
VAIDGANHPSIGELVNTNEDLRDRRALRGSGEITVYRSVGVAARDAAAAGLVFEAARQRGMGVSSET